MSTAQLMHGSGDWCRIGFQCLDATELEIWAWMSGEEESTACGLGNQMQSGASPPKWIAGQEVIVSPPHHHWSSAPPGAPAPGLACPPPVFLPTTARAAFLKCTTYIVTPCLKSSALLPQLIEIKTQSLPWFTGSHLTYTPLLQATSLLDSPLPSLHPGTLYSSHQGLLLFISSKGSPALLLLASAWNASPVSLPWEALLTILAPFRRLLVLLPLQSYHSSYHSGDWFHLPLCPTRM